MGIYLYRYLSIYLSKYVSIYLYLYIYMSIYRVNPIEKCILLLHSVGGWLQPPNRGYT